MGSEQSVGIGSLTRALFILCVATLLQSVVANHLRVAGYTADVMLVTTILIGLVSNPRRGALMGLLCGFIADVLFRTTPLGLSALSFALTGYIAGSLRAGMLRGVAGLNAVLCAILSLVGILLFVLIATLFGTPDLLSVHLAPLMLIVSLLNGLFALVFGPLIRWGFAEPESPQLKVVKA